MYPQLAAPLTITAPPALAARCEAWWQAERTQLPLFMPVMLGIGIAAYFLLPWAGQRWAAAAAAMALLVAGLGLTGLNRRVAVTSAVLILLGMALAGQRTAAVAAPRLAGRVVTEFSGTVQAVEIRSGRDQVRLRIAPDPGDLPPLVRISVKGGIDPAITAGARVSLRAQLGPPAGPSYPGGYDFARRAWFEGLGATGFPMGPITLLVPAPPPHGLAAWLAALRVRLTAQLHDRVGGAPGAIAAAFVTGDQGAIPQDVNQAMRDSGLAHLLSISGLHIAIVVGGTMWLTRRTLALSPWLALRLPVKTIAAAAAALAGIGYTVLAGAEVPTVRTCLATLIVLAGIIIGREALSLRMIAAGAFIILAIRPEALLGPSFQLSFAAVTGLVALYQSRLGTWLADRAEMGWGGRLLRGSIAMVVTGLVAEAMLAATALYHFNRTGVFGVVANLIAIPLTSFVIMPLLLLALLLDPLGLAGPLYAAVFWSMALLIRVAETVAAWPGAVAHLPLMPDHAYALIVGGGLWLCLWATRGRLYGLLPVAAGLLLAVTARPPDLLVSADGRHAALLVGDGRLALLRDRAGDYIRDMWGDATGATAIAALSELPGADCSVDACVAAVQDRGEAWRLLATLSRDRINRRRFGPACAAADIVVSDRRLPGWCAPRWLKLDRASLGDSGAVAIWLAERRVETVAARLGDHPWLPKAATREERELLYQRSLAGRAAGRTATGQP